MNHTEMAVTGSWVLWLVVLSYVVSVFASYTALNLAGRVVATRGWARRIWLAGGAFAMGTGIWAMHFTGMQAFKVPTAYFIEGGRVDDSHHVRRSHEHLSRLLLRSPPLAPRSELRGFWLGLFARRP